MSNKEHFTGLKEVMGNLTREMDKLNGEPTIQGLIKFAITVRRAMDKQEPKIPVGKTGNLRASFFTVTRKSSEGVGESPRFAGKNKSEMGARHSAVRSAAASEVSGRVPEMIMGFSANYAGYVHEAREGLNYKRPGAGPKFFESAVKNNMPQLMKILAENLKID